MAARFPRFFLKVFSLLINSSVRNLNIYGIIRIFRDKPVAPWNMQSDFSMNFTVAFNEESNQVWADYNQ